MHPLGEEGHIKSGNRGCAFSEVTGKESRGGRRQDRESGEGQNKTLFLLSLEKRLLTKIDATCSKSEMGEGVGPMA